MPGRRELSVLIKELFSSIKTYDKELQLCMPGCEAIVKMLIY